MDPEEAARWLWRSISGEGPSIAEQGYGEYRRAENAREDAAWNARREVSRNNHRHVPPELAAARVARRTNAAEVERSRRLDERADTDQWQAGQDARRRGDRALQGQYNVAVGALRDQRLQEAGGDWGQNYNAGREDVVHRRTDDPAVSGYSPAEARRIQAEMLEERRTRERGDRGPRWQELSRDERAAYHIMRLEQEAARGERATAAGVPHGPRDTNLTRALESMDPDLNPYWVNGERPYRTRPADGSYRSVSRLDRREHPRGRPDPQDPRWRRLPPPQR